MHSVREALVPSASCGEIAWYLGLKMLDQESDGQVVRRVGERADLARARDAEAELCRRFAPRVRLYGLRHLRDEDRARDLVQAVLEALIHAARAGRVENLEHVDRFVLGTCRNVTLRVRATEARVIPTDPSDLDVESVAPPVDRVETGALMRCMATLVARARTVVFLSFHEDKAADEIGVALGTTPGNVRVLRHRAIAQLRSCLDAHGVES
jgi:RNA polymerase sigma-70 factor (ECF subfamily)